MQRVAYGLQQPGGALAGGPSGQTYGPGPPLPRTQGADQGCTPPLRDDPYLHSITRIRRSGVWISRRGSSLGCFPSRSSCPERAAAARATAARSPRPALAGVLREATYEMVTLWPTRPRSQQMTAAAAGDDACWSDPGSGDKSNSQRALAKGRGGIVSLLSGRCELSWVI